MLLELGQRRHTRRLQGSVGLDLVCKDLVHNGQNFPSTVATFASHLSRCRSLTSRIRFGMVLRTYARDRLTIYRGGPPKPSGGFSRILDIYNPPCRWKLTKVFPDLDITRASVSEATLKALVADPTDRHKWTRDLRNLKAALELHDASRRG